MKGSSCTYQGRSNAVPFASATRVWRDAAADDSASMGKVDSRSWSVKLCHRRCSSSPYTYVGRVTTFGISRPLRRGQQTRLIRERFGAVSFH